MNFDELITLGNRLEYWIERQYGRWGGKTKCAEALGITPQQLSAYIQDKVYPGRDISLRLAGLGVNLHWLATGDGPMEAPSKGNAQQIVGTIQLHDQGKTYGLVRMPEQKKEEEDDAETT